MKFKPCTGWKTAIVSLGVLALAHFAQAQINTNPVPNLAISWDLNAYGFANAVGGAGQPVPDTSAGLALATNWNDSWEENYSDVSSSGVSVANLFDITGSATSAGLTYAGYNGYAGDGDGYRPPQDANGTYNLQMLNGYLNAGPASWSPPITNSYVSLTNIPYSTYDVVVYIDSDTSGRNFQISDGATSFYGSTLGGVAEVEGANALFVPATQTNRTQLSGADFVFFPGLKGGTNTFTCYPLSGNDQWLGISAFQVIQSSNVYVLYGASPAAQTVPVGQPASFSVIAGGLNPTYQWQHAGTNLLNATNATYAIAATAVGQDGSYEVVVDNNFSSATSAVATLTFYTPKSLEWNGAGSTWDTVSPDWTLNGGISATNYTQTDKVTFDPLGAAQSAVSLSATLTPSAITVSNASYTLTGGGLGGSGSLHVTGDGTLILDTVDGSSGPTLVDNGSTLQIDNGDSAGSLGSGALTNNGSLVFNSSGNPAYGYPIYGTGIVANSGSGGELTLANNINASYLEQSGSGSTLLQGSNNITGGLIVSDGTLLARAANCLAPNTTVGGGELQLIFNIAFAGTNITLSGGDLHGGISGDDSFGGTVTLAVDSQINVDGGDSLTLSNPSGIAAAGYNLYLGGGGGTLILAGTNNTWESVTIQIGTLQIGNGGGGSLGGGTVTDLGTLAFDATANLLVTNLITGSGNINLNGPGAVIFAGDLSTVYGETTVADGTLGGAITNGGSVSVLPGATLEAGTASAIGTMTIESGLTLGGNVLAKVNKSLVQSNDIVVVPGGVSNTNNGIVTVNNLGPALKMGDQFTLFSQPVYGGATMSVSGGGVTWSNNLANDGSIIVLSTVASYATNLSFTVSNGTLSLSWPATHLGWILQTQTNSLGTGLSTNWTDVAGSANVTSTTMPVNPAVPAEFYRLRQP